MVQEEISIIRVLISSQHECKLAFGVTHRATVQHQQRVLYASLVREIDSVTAVKRLIWSKHHPFKQSQDPRK